MTDIVLLASENLLRELTGVSDNVASKYITAALREAQDIRVKSVIGGCLLSRVQELIVSKEIDTDTRFIMYRDLADKIKYFLVYAAVTELARQVSYKVTNAGVVKTADENVQNASFSEVMSQVEYYETKADYYCIELQKWLCCNASAFPELDCDCLCRIKSNLTSAASCGIWLGGARGKSYPTGGGCCG